MHNEKRQPPLAKAIARLQSMTDHRRARQLGHRSLLALFALFALGCPPIALLAANESMFTWDGGECSLEHMALQTQPVFNLIVGPCNVLIAVMFISMTVTAAGFVFLLCGLLLPFIAGYLIVALSLPHETTAGDRIGFDHSAVIGVAVMAGSFFVGVSIGL